MELNKSKKAKRQKFGLGSIVAVPLTDGRFAFLKIYRNQAAVYDLVLEHIPDVNVVLNSKIAFFHAGPETAIKKGLWPVIGEQPFEDLEDAWPPPKATCYDWEENRWTMWGVPHVNHKGQTFRATLEQVQGLDILAVSPSVEGFVRTIERRLIKGLNDEFKVKPS